MNFQLQALPLPFVSSTFDVMVLQVESKALKNNPLGDDHRRWSYILKPAVPGPHPVVFHFSGYFGNGPQSFNLKTMEESFPEQIAKATEQKQIPLAHHIFVDAMTSLGGSQFINSRGCGQYGDYVSQDLLSAVRQALEVKEGAAYAALLGGSSGGYGALAHIASAGSPFGVAMAIAPDSLFELSLLPDYYKASESLKTIPDVATLKQKIVDSRFRESKSFFSIINAIAMALCYSQGDPTQIHYPIDLHSGEINKKEFTDWKSKDPVEFLTGSAELLKEKQIYLSVGRYDEYNLQFGARRIHDVLNQQKIQHQYLEFDGGHFKSTQRKIEALQWLKKIWK